MLLLLVLSACARAGVGLLFDTYEETYGSTHRIFLPRKAQTIEFFPQHESGRNVLWDRDDPDTIQDPKRRVTGSYYVMRKVTQKDSGRYIIKDRDRIILGQRVLEVIARTVEYSKRNGDWLSMLTDLEGIDCNIYFYPRNGSEKEFIVYQGRMSDLSFCTSLTFEKPCEISSTYLEKTCDGRFEFRDHYDGMAVVMYLEIEPLFYEKPQFAAGIAALILSIVSACMRVCCCGKRSSKKNNADTPSDDDESASNSEPAVFYHEGRHGPVGPRTDPNPAQPSVPLIHSPPHTVPSYSENHNERAGPSAEPVSEPSGTCYADQSSVPLIPPTAEPPSYSEVMSRDGAQMFPLSSGPELRYEVKGMTFDSAPPLSSDTAEPSVYTSEKLNFL